MLPVFKSIQLIIEKRGLVKIADLPPAVCLSERQFKRQFIRNTGFTPNRHILSMISGNFPAFTQKVSSPANQV